MPDKERKQRYKLLLNANDNITQESLGIRFILGLRIYFLDLTVYSQHVSWIWHGIGYTFKFVIFNLKSWNISISNGENHIWVTLRQHVGPCHSYQELKKIGRNIWTTKVSFEHFSFQMSNSVFHIGLWFNIARVHLLILRN